MISLHLLRFSLLLFFFSSAKTIAYAQVYESYINRTIDMGEEDDWTRHSLIDYSNNTSLAELLVKEIRANNLHVYSLLVPSESLMNIQDFDKLLSPAVIDSYIEVECPPPCEGVTIYNKQKIDLAQITQYSVLQIIKVDQTTGRSTIQIEGIAPMAIDVRGKAGDTPKPLFWLRYIDIKNILDRYEQYHPDNTLALHIWHDYFLSDKKPTPVK